MVGREGLALPQGHLSSFCHIVIVIVIAIVIVSKMSRMSRMRMMRMMITRKMVMLRTVDLLQPYLFSYSHKLYMRTLTRTNMRTCTRTLFENRLYEDL